MTLRNTGDGHLFHDVYYLVAQGEDTRVLPVSRGALAKLRRALEGG